MKQKTAYLFLAAAVLFFLIDTLQKISYSADDTFIYMQYARNIAGGNGFSFNPGEPSYGVTSPLWVLILSFIYILGLDGFWFSKILDLFSAALSAMVFYRLSKHFFREKDNSFLPAAAASLFIINIWFIRWSFTGMETNLAVLFTLLVLYNYYKENYKIAFFLLGLFFLVRPEAVFFFFVILISLFIERRVSLKEDYQNILLYTVFFLIPVIPFLVFSKMAFGTVIANTALGKSTLTLGFNIIKAQLIEIVKTLAPSNGIEILLGIIFFIFILRKKQFSNYAVLILWPCVLILIYIVTDADIISRYFMIITPVFTLLAVKAIDIFNKMKFASIIVFFVISLAVSQITFYLFVKPHVENFTEGVQECLIPIGEWFNTQTPPGTRILVNDVGAIGYYSNRYVIDAAALINRDLELNRKIMSTPLEKRMNPYNLLEFIDADYVVERDTVLKESISAGGKILELVFYKKFKGLGISDEREKFYGVYKINRRTN